MRPILHLIGFAVFFCAGAHAQQVQTPATHAYIVDLSTGTVLLDKNSSAPMPPASMSKLMTVYMVFEALRSGDLELESMLPISRKAWKKGGSKMFVRVGEMVSVSDLLRGIIVQSGNDACIVVAEALAGSEEKFASSMTRRARELGLSGSNFVNSTGWPHPDHWMSARDLAKLSRIIIEEFPDLYAMFKEKTFVYNKIKQGNRNPLLYRDTGADGLKTGYTKGSGYGLTASAVRDQRRIVMVLNGLSNARRRSGEARRLLDWAFNAFRPYQLFAEGEVVDRASVWLGREASVPLTIARDVKLSLSRKSRAALKVTVRLVEPVSAPVRKGARLGSLVVSAPPTEALEIPLVAGADVERLGFFGRIGSAARHLLFGAP